MVTCRTRGRGHWLKNRIAFEAGEQLGAKDRCIPACIEPSLTHLVVPLLTQPQQRKPSRSRNMDLYKTALCDYWAAGMPCRFGDRCCDFPRKTNVTSSALKLTHATKIPSSRTSHTPTTTALQVAKKISLVMKNCSLDMPVDSIMSESQSSESTKGKQTASSMQMACPTMRRKCASKTGDEAEPLSRSISE
uniref:C3H1-type domain-containing protein n=1 Tax=Parascaris univalens TaxID=6257 RepID=A0A915BWM6_PARUN